VLAVRGGGGGGVMQGQGCPRCAVLVVSFGGFRSIWVKERGRICQNTLN